MANASDGDAVPPDQFREILLTGATGFVGRFLLRELLRQDDRLVVHCLVRAKDAESGFDRIRNALEYAEIWEESLAPRLRIVTGDITEKRLGLPASEYETLCGRIDAVYHAAAGVNIVQSYDQSRETNVFGVQSILDLCLKGCRKHLFYFSTMAVFPEYICNFAREYAGCRIEDQTQPDLEEMKRTFPLGYMGYPWSKLVAEQAVLFAKSAGVPVAIFRLPQMSLASNGYTQASNFPSRLLGAVVQIEKVPSGLSVQLNPEPVDTVCEVCTSISRNPDRKFTIYHCCNSEPPFEDLEYADFGFHWQVASYESFKRSCLAAGKRSPLQGYWVPLDHYAPYWFDSNAAKCASPINDDAIRVDCPHQIRWPAMLVKHARSYSWVRRHRDEWPFPLPQGRLEFEGLMARAGQYAERMEVSFSETYPSWIQAGLKQLVGSLTSPQAGLLESRISYVNYGLSQSLRSNAALARERQEHPEINRQKVTQPVFIVGINRTGTTFLHRLLARDPAFWSLQRYELTDPVLASGEYATVAGTDKDPRRAYAEEILNATHFVETLSGIHRIDLEEPEEDYILLKLAFATWVLTVAHIVPDYGRWLAETGSRNAYSHHRMIMKHFTWQRRQRDRDTQRTWLLKMPFHLKELGALLEAYPDAVFIQTHRDPVELMGSWNSLVERLRSFTTEPQPPHETGAEQLVLMSGMLNDAMKFRSLRDDLRCRWVDVRYVDLVDDPMAVVRGIYDRFGWSLSDSAIEAMQDWLALQAGQRRKEPRHEYRLEDYGIVAADVNEAFSPYLEFAANRGIM